MGLQIMVLCHVTRCTSSALEMGKAFMSHIWHLSREPSDDTSKPLISVSPPWRVQISYKLLEHFTLQNGRTRVERQEISF